MWSAPAHVLTYSALPGGPLMTRNPAVDSSSWRGLASAVALLLVIACGVIACGRPVTPETRQAYADLVVPPAQCAAQAPEGVEPVEVRRDLRVLERVIRRAYGGFESAGDEARWARAFGAIRAAVPDTAMEPLDLRDLLIEHLDFMADNHVGLWLYVPDREWRSSFGHAQAYVAPSARFTRRAGGFVDDEGRRLESCDGASPEEVLRPTAGPALPRLDHVPYVLSRTSRDSLRCELSGAEAVEYALVRLDVSQSSPGDAFERVAAPFPWLRLRSLFADRRSALEEFVASAEGLRGEPVVVLDLRRAGGGSDRFLLRWFRELTSQTLHYWETDALTSEATLQGALTFWGCVRAAGGADPAGQAWLDARVERARDELDEAMRRRGLFRERTREARELEGRAPSPFAGRLLLVVDRGCNSACETSVLLARQIPGALVVGENTEGTMKVGELRWYRLPESRLWISLGMRAHRDPEARFEEGRGFLPDIWLDGVDPDARIQELARCLADDACAERLVAGSR